MTAHGSRHSFYGSKCVSSFPSVISKALSGYLFMPVKHHIGWFTANIPKLQKFYTCQLVISLLIGVP